MGGGAAAGRRRTRQRVDEVVEVGVELHGEHVAPYLEHVLRVGRPHRARCGRLAGSTSNDGPSDVPRLMRPQNSMAVPRPIRKAQNGAALCLLARCPALCFLGVVRRPPPSVRGAPGDALRRPSAVLFSVMLSFVTRLGFESGRHLQKRERHLGLQCPDCDCVRPRRNLQTFLSCLLSVGHAPVRLYRTNVTEDETIRCTTYGLERLWCSLYVETDPGGRDGRREGHSVTDVHLTSNSIAEDSLTDLTRCAVISRLVVPCNYSPDLVALLTNSRNAVITVAVCFDSALDDEVTCRRSS